MEQSKFGQGIMSTKVSEAGKGGAGGQSQWSIGMDNAPDDRFGNNNKVGNAPKPSAQQPSQQLPSEQKKEEAPDAGPGAFTSVKYSGNPPGGKSSITF